MTAILVEQGCLPDGCWLYTGDVNSKGYGRIRRHGKRVMAHRAVYELIVGPIPEEYEIDHLCRQHACVNPAHLEAVTASVNIRRGTSPAADRAAQTHCKRGHPLMGDNLERTKRWRNCAECRREREREARRRRMVTA